MRTIKFRGKKIYGDGWAYGLLSDIDEQDGIAELGTKFGVEYVHLDTVGQFTGLHDSKGNEIYEGDLLGTRDYSRHYLEVKYADGGFRLCGTDDEVGFGSVHINNLIDKNNLVIEVLGNIHDNPSLLKGGQSD